MDEAHLASIPLFAELSRDERRRVAHWADEVDVPAGRHLVDEGEFGYEFFVIEEGTAEVARAGSPVAELGPGDFFGEIALIETERRTASVVSTSPMRLIVMTRRDFRQMAAEMPEVATGIGGVLAERLRRDG